MTNKTSFDLRRMEILELPGERARLRRIRVDDGEELERLISIELDENVRRYVLESLEADDFPEFARGSKKYITLAVAGKTEHVGDSESDKLQGWLLVYSDNRNRLKRAEREGLLTYDEGRVYLEIGFARYPLAKQGQMGSALRCLVASLAKYFEKQKLKLCLTGYVHPNNEGSKRVLAAAGFKHVGEMPYTLKDKHHDCVYLLDFVDK